ncbi:MAG TPA: hypothetical protein VII96_04180 [Acidimicrobiales bacterium]
MSPGTRHDGSKRRRWPWFVGGLVVVLGVGGLVGWLTTSHARQVTLHQAEARQGAASHGSPADGRPAPGVYAYAGTGTERLSLPPLSQAEGPIIPGTVTLDGARCWTLRLDYSTHHWQTWHYCLHGTDLWETGGQTWQLWPVGPLNFTNTTTFVCAAGTMAVPAQASPGQTWTSRCTGTNTSVTGTTVSSGPYRLVGTTMLSVGGTQVRVVHFHRVRTDSGAQTGTETADEWFEPGTGLPVRLAQNLRITTSTAFGVSTYTQVGTMTLRSLTPEG